MRTVTGGKGDSHLLPERPFGCFAQKVAVTFSLFGWRVLGVLALAWLATLAGCGKSDKDSATSESGAQQAAQSGPKVYTIGMSQGTLDEPRYVQMDKDVEDAAAKHPNVKVSFRSAEGDSSRQRAHLEEFIRQPVDLIIVSPDEAVPLTEPVGKAVDAGIPVVVLDRPIVGQKYTCLLTADDKNLGRAAAEWLVKRLGGKGNLIELVAPPDSVIGRARREGFHAALKDRPDVRILRECIIQGKADEDQSELASALAAFNKIDAVYAYNDQAARAAYLAAQKTGRQKEMIFVGIGALPDEGIAYVKQRCLDATVLYPTGGAEAIEVALKILQKQTFEKNIDLPSRIYTKDNVEQGGEPIE